MEAAARQGYSALALTDECSLAGVVKAHQAAKSHAIPLIIGSEFTLADGLKLVLLAQHRSGYGQLSTLISHARCQAAKGSYRLTRADLTEHELNDCLALWLPGEVPNPADGVWLAQGFPQRLWIGVELLLEGRDAERLATLQQLGASLNLPLVACNDVHMHRRNRKVLQDTLTAIRLKTPLAQLGYALHSNAERHLRPLAQLQQIYPAELLAASAQIAARCKFSLDELRYEYPRELIPEGYTPAVWLRKLTDDGARQRWPHGMPDKVRDQVERELQLIAALAYEPFFLTVHDLVRFARSRGILCQGRGSAANSAVCYCLGITEVDPARLELLFERFISRERNEPPDIDVDFEHERREEVIQYIYQKYGRHRAALAASVTTYRSRSAIRDVGKALGLDLATVERLLSAVDRLDGYRLTAARAREQGFDPSSPVLRRLAALVNTLLGFPRHLSQHVGGFVIAADQLAQLVPVENAAMAERTVIQWDKDDLEALGLLKVDVLALGMLSAIRKALTYLGTYTGRTWRVADIPPEDPAVYAMLRQGDAMGVFQVESRAQMSMLPRLKPKCYYDLVVEVAIVRPGPIQGNMVHPYLARRAGREKVVYPNPAVEKVLERTLGVPIFQEQVMQLAMVAAGFTAGEADQLRRAMAAWHRKGGLEKFQRKLLDGMAARGYSTEFAQRIYDQIKGFGEYGFPESHSASFALLVYVSAWLKHYHPAAFTAALLNSQPMGFYAPAQLVQDARRHGVAVRPVDVVHSGWDCAVELLSGGSPALRLGLRMVGGLSRGAADALIAARNAAPYQDLDDLARRTALARGELEHLAAADAFASLVGHRHRAFWQTSGVAKSTPIFPDPRIPEAEPLLRRPEEGEEILDDYAAIGLTLRRHPVALVRDRLQALGTHSCAELAELRSGARARIAGLAVCRQQPMTASGVLFVTLEDETGQVNLIVWPKVAKRYRKAVLHSALLLASGTVQQEDGVLHLLTEQFQDLSGWLHGLRYTARDFH